MNILPSRKCISHSSNYIYSTCL